MDALNNRLVINDAVISTVVDGETLLLNVESGVYFGLDAIGSEIWESIGRGDSEEAIVNQLLADYEVEEDCLRADVRTFIAGLTHKGLVQEDRP